MPDVHARAQTRHESSILADHRRPQDVSAREISLVNATARNILKTCLMYRLMRSNRKFDAASLAYLGVGALVRTHRVCQELERTKGGHRKWV